MNPMKYLLIFGTVLVLATLLITWQPVKASPAPVNMLDDGYYEGKIQFDAVEQNHNHPSSVHDQLYFNRFNIDSGTIRILIYRTVGYYPHVKEWVDLGPIHGYILEKDRDSSGGTQCNNDVYLDGDYNSLPSRNAFGGLGGIFPIQFAKDTIYTYMYVDGCPSGSGMFDPNTKKIQYSGYKLWLNSLKINPPRLDSAHDTFFTGDCDFPSGAWHTTYPEPGGEDAFSLDCSWVAFKRTSPSSGWKK